MKNSLIWFRNDLRTYDNSSLTRACEANTVVAIYCFDPRQFGKTEFGFDKTGKFRAKFLLESVTNLQQRLARLNIPLLVFHDTPESVLPQVIESLNIPKLFCQLEWTSEERQVTEKVRGNLPETVTLTESFDQFLYHPSDLPYPSYSDLPRVFTEFRKKCEQYCTVHTPLSEPTPRTGGFADTAKFPVKVPSLEALGHPPFHVDPRSALTFTGGEDAAWQRLDHYFWETQALKRYKQTRNGLLGADYSSKFSPWLANGSISPRSIYAQVKKFEEKIEKNEDTYWLIFELIWRDFFKYVSLKHGDALFGQDGILQKKEVWHHDQQAVNNWIEGKSPYDFVNANMVEIAQTGFMSNRGRQNVASYFAKELKQDWRIGASYFESMLIDYDVHSNWGNWQYNSGVGNDPRDRKFNIESQAQRYDPDGAYVRHWLSDSNNNKKTVS